MAVVIEFFFRPQNLVARLVARLIKAPTCGVVRGGINMSKQGDPYQFAAAFCSYNHVDAEMKALCNRIKLSDAKDGCSALAQVGLNPFFIRMGEDGVVEKVCVKTQKGVSIMKIPKAKIPHVNDVINSDGSLNLASLAAAFTTGLVQHLAGNIDITDITATQTDQGASTLPGFSKKIGITINFTRHE